MNSSLLINPQLLPQTSTDTPADQPAPATDAAEGVLASPGFWEGMLWIMGFVIMTQFIPFIGLAIWTISTTGDFAMENEYLLPTLFFGQILGVCFSLLVLRVRVGRDWVGAIQLKRPAWRPCLLAAACVPALILVGYGVVNWVENVVGSQDPTKEMMIASMSQYSVWFCLLVVAVGAAVNEELFCRGFLGRGLVARHGIFMGVVITSLVFGSIHLNLPQGIWACILGVFLHLAYLATRSLWVPILLHFLNNTIAVLMQLMLPDFEPTLVQLAMIVIPAYAVAIPAAWALYRLREPQTAEAPLV